MPLILRNVKGSDLTYTELDNNLKYLRGLLGSISSNVIDLDTGECFAQTISGATTFSTTNVPASGNTAVIRLRLTNGGSAVVTWWSGVKWAGGAAPTLTTSGVDTLTFVSTDGGTTWDGTLVGKAMA